MDIYVGFITSSHKGTPPICSFSSGGSRGGGKGGNCPSLGPKKRREEVKGKKRKQGKREKRRGESRKKESKAKGTYTV